MKIYKGVAFLERKEISDLLTHKKISGPLEIKNIQKKDLLGIIPAGRRCSNEAIKYAKNKGYHIICIQDHNRLFQDKVTMAIFEFYKIDKLDKSTYEI